MGLVTGTVVVVFRVDVVLSTVTPEVQAVTITSPMTQSFLIIERYQSIEYCCPDFEVGVITGSAECDHDFGVGDSEAVNQYPITDAGFEVDYGPLQSVGCVDQCLEALGGRLSEARCRLQLFEVLECDGHESFPSVGLDEADGLVDQVDFEVIVGVVLEDGEVCGGFRCFDDECLNTEVHRQCCVSTCDLNRLRSHRPALLFVPSLENRRHTCFAAGQLLGPPAKPDRELVVEHPAPLVTSLAGHEVAVAVECADQTPGPRDCRIWRIGV